MPFLKNYPFLGKIAFGFIIGVLAIALCYFYFDPLIAYKMAKYHLPKSIFLKWMNDISTAARIFAFLLIITLGIKAGWKPLTRNEKSFFTLGLAAGISIYLKDLLKVGFGRFWPATWYMDNPSLLKDQAYGFHFWKWDYAYGAFPSGHTTIVFCVMTFVWVLAPKWRWAAAVICTIQIIPLLLLNYHFLGDLISGALLGSLCAIFAIRINHLAKKENVN